VLLFTASYRQIILSGRLWETSCQEITQKDQGWFH